MSKSDYISKATIKADYGLTDSLIKQLGAPDKTKRNPHFRKAAPMQLFSRERVETWIADNRDLIEASKPRKKSARQAVATKRQKALLDFQAAVSELEMRPTPPRPTLYQEAADFISRRYGNQLDTVSDKALCAHVRHKYTNYDVLVSTLPGKVGRQELHTDFKLYLCCRIVKQYDLNLHPCEAVNEVTPDDYKTMTASDLQQHLASKLEITES